MGFLGRLLYKISVFMQGRYGMDGLCTPILIVSCAFTLLGTLFHAVILRAIGSLLLILMAMRMLSKNHSARQKELYAYENLKNNILSWFQNKSFRTEQKHIRKDQKAIRKEQKKVKRYFKCPQCKTELSVPKGKGKIQITCVKCKHQFIKKT